MKKLSYLALAATIAAGSLALVAPASAATGQVTGNTGVLATSAGCATGSAAAAVCGCTPVASARSAATAAVRARRESGDTRTIQ